MQNIILLFLCLIVGIALQKVKAFPKNTHTVLNQYVLWVSLPAMALHYLPKISLGVDLLFPASVAWIGFGASFLFFSFLGKQLGWSRKLIGCLIITGGLGNTSFVGIPVIEALYGKEGLQTLIIVDLPGTFIVLSTLGILTAGMYSSKKQSESVLKKILTFPAFIAFLVGIALAGFQIDFPPALSEAFKSLAATVSPVALISVGFQLKFRKDSKHFKYLALGLAFQLLIVPAIIMGLFWGVFDKTDMATKICIIEAAMPPMVTGAILASSYGLKPQLSNMMVGFGIPISFLTLGFWYYIVELFLI
ncbi:MAG: AEC family transporter [Flavobacteriaceae bacterium]